MQFLLFLQQLRTPFWDKFFLAVTSLGEETVFILAGLFLFWCVDKKKGYYVLLTGLLCNTLLWYLKAYFRVARPWLQNAALAAVDGAAENAIGYSFPSGHSANAATVIGGAAVFCKKPWRILLFALTVLVAFSRLYLGVHTPADAAAGLFLGCLLLCLLYSPLYKAGGSKSYCAISALCIALALFFPVFQRLLPATAANSAEFDAHSLETAWKFIGAALAVLPCIILERRYSKFETAAPTPIQALKLVVGAGLVLALKELLKLPLQAALPSHFADAARYFILIFFAVFVYPLSFRLYNKKR